MRPATRSRSSPKPEPESRRVQRLRAGFAGTSRGRVNRRGPTPGWSPTGSAPARRCSSAWWSASTTGNRTLSRTRAGAAQELMTSPNRHSPHRGPPSTVPLSRATDPPSRLSGPPTAAAPTSPCRRGWSWEPRESRSGAAGRQAGTAPCPLRRGRRRGVAPVLAGKAVHRPPSAGASSPSRAQAVPL
jgi:hypothetical protein